ncbi:hypothetical protein QBC40DRAFT_300971 [Triangularia verruculosa]|uniref:Uncharacterized protein n=1 Tax=Triangularia verruculosa TaxID=2587418 RepID=A0AAN6X8X5_9PEZI|nr:hypothetical protein QBC40DRAFT_300971 [Triangularia verruculosa]
MSGPAGETASAPSAGGSGGGFDLLRRATQAMMSNHTAPQYHQVRSTPFPPVNPSGSRWLGEGLSSEVAMETEGPDSCRPVACALGSPCPNMDSQSLSYPATAAHTYETLQTPHPPPLRWPTALREVESVWLVPSSQVQRWARCGLRYLSSPCGAATPVPAPLQNKCQAHHVRLGVVSAVSNNLICTCKNRIALPGFTAAATRVEDIWLDRGGAGVSSRERPDSLSERTWKLLAAGRMPWIDQSAHPPTGPLTPPFKPDL